MVREGLRADLVVLHCDPLSDLGALRDIDCVFKDGTLVWTTECRRPFPECGEHVPM